MADKTLVQVKGIIKKKLPDQHAPEGSGKKWVKRTFIVSQSNGEKDLFITTFNKFDNSFIGKEVELEAEHNPTYNSYMLKGDIQDRTPDDVADPVVEEGEATTPKPKAKAKPKKKEAPKVEEVVTPDSVTADELVEANLLGGKALLERLGYKKYSVSELVSVADMLGRTKVALRIEAGKDRRMKEFK